LKESRLDQLLKLQRMLTPEIVRLVAHRAGTSPRKAARRARQLGLPVERGGPMSRQEAEELFIDGGFPRDEQQGCALSFVLIGAAVALILLLAWLSGVLDGHVFRTR